MITVRQGISSALLLVLCLGAVPAQAEADDTFRHLTLGGPVITLSDSFGYDGYKLMKWQEGTIIDARGGVWLSSMYCTQQETCKQMARNSYPVQIGADWVDTFPDRVDLYNYGLCPEPPAQKIHWLGGVIEGTAPLDISWGESKNNNGAGITMNAIGHVVDGIRMHNLHDPYVPLAGNDFTLTNSWITHSRDDAIENDAFAAGLIEDNYIEGFHFFYSCTNTGGLRNGWTPNAHAPGGGAGTTVRIENNLIAFKALNSYKGTPWGGLWKDWDRDPSAPTGTRSPDIDFVDNIVYIPAGPTGRCGLTPSHKGLIEGNIVVDMAGCTEDTPGFTILTGEEGQAFWDAAVRAWLEGHPKVARISTDPDFATWRTRQSMEQ